jgi:hypothetical protein
MFDLILLDDEQDRAMLHLYSDGSQGRRRHSTRELLLRPSNVWTTDRQEPWQPKGLKQWIIYLIYEKKKKPKKLG